MSWRGADAGLVSWSFRVSSLQKRVAAYAKVSRNLLTQLNELDQLRERVRKLSLRLAKAKEDARESQPDPRT